MKTLTIRLPDVLARRIEEESLARRVSKSDVVRERLTQSGLPTFQESDVQAILEASWAAKVPPQTSRFASGKKQKLAALIRAKKLHR